MSQAVVDQLESIEIQHENGEYPPLVSPGTIQRDLDPVEEKGPVGKTRQPIVKGRMFQLLGVPPNLVLRLFPAFGQQHQFGVS